MVAGRPIHRPQPAQWRGSITGRAGSGKTSSSGREIGQAIINHPRSGGLILAAKPEDLEMWQGIFAKAGRVSDLLVFAPENSLRFNFLGYVLGMGGNTRDVTRCITVIGETLRAADTKGGESADFWEREQERMIYNAVEVVRVATGSVSAPAIQRFISSAPMALAQIATSEWRAGFCNQCLADAFEKKKPGVETHDYQLAADYWLSEFPSMAEKTRSSIMTGVMGILHVFNTGIVRELASTSTNVSPDDLLAGKWVIVNMAPAEWGDMGALIAAGWKYLVQRRVLRRKTEAKDSVVVIWADEYAQFVNSYDAHYLAQCRSHMGCMVVLTQSLHSYFMTMKGETGKHQANALLTNFSTKVFHALGDVETAEWASGLIGKGRELFVGTSLAPVEDLYTEIMGRTKVSTNASEHYEAMLKPNQLMNGLRTGGVANDLLCDAVVIRSGEPFADGSNWMWRVFSQRGWTVLKYSGAYDAKQSGQPG
ncbi:MAG: TraM recognition domain-containing protein [Pirellulales bacterium]